MKYYYQDQNVHCGEEVPAGAIEITEDRYHELEKAKAQGKLLTVDSAGNPVVYDPIYYKDRKFYFYSTDTIPEGAIEVSEADYRMLMDAVQNGGKMIDTGVDGKPVAVEPYMFYSQGGFYDLEIHADIPAGAVKILKTYWEELMAGQTQGKRIEPDEHGYPILIDPPDNTPEVQKARALRLAHEKLDRLQFVATVRSIPIEDNATALAVAPACPDWSAGTHYEACDVVNHNGQAYKVIQAVDSLENQPPDAEGMLAIYRPLMPEHNGTPEDPIPFVSGMDVYSGKYYAYNGATYLAKADMLPCTWAPDTQGLWQWEKQPDNVSNQ